MALVVSHTFVSAVTDGADATLVRPSNWNAAHTLTGILDVASGGTGAASFTSGAYLKGAGGSAFTVQTTPITTVDLGSGVASSSNFLRGDQTWAVPTSGGTNEFFGTGGDGAITDNAGGTIIRNGILNATTYALATSVATTLTHDVSRATHIKASTGISMGATALVFGNGKGGSGGAGGAAGGFPAGNGGPGVHGGGGGGGSTTGTINTLEAPGGRGGGLAGGTGGTSRAFDEAAAIGTSRAGLAGQTVQYITDVGYGGRQAGPGGGGGGGAGGDVTVGKAGGAGGGYFIFEAVAITLTAGFAYRATGSAGATTGATEEGAGGGGAGGTFIQMRRTLTGTMSVTVTGGAGGTVGGGGSGTAGGAGAAGQFIDEVLV